MELTDSELTEYEHSQNSDRRNKNYSKETEQWFINRDHTPFGDDFNNDEVGLVQDREYIKSYNEINDIKEIEEELKQNLVNSNSKFMNPTFEEPSPSKLNGIGAYHSNIIGFTSGQPQDFQIPNKAQCDNNQALQLKSSSNSANIPRDYFIRKDVGSSSISNNWKFMLNDQISMFSSQDPKIDANKINTSDIVEYSQDHLALKKQNILNYYKELIVESYSIKVWD